jgi:hypothetical protein
MDDVDFSGLLEQRGLLRDGYRRAVSVIDSVWYADAVRGIIAFINAVGNSNVICVTDYVTYSVGYDVEVANDLTVGNTIELAVGNAIADLGFVTFWYIHRVCVSDVYSV